MKFFSKSTGRRWTVALTLALVAERALGVTCSVTPLPLNFGSYNTTTDLSVATTVQISCGAWGQSSSVNYTLSASAGSGSYSGRQMANGSNSITYNLYTDSTDTTVFGNGTSGSITLTGTVTKQTSPVTVTIYGLIRGGQNVVPGSYANNPAITLTLTY
jgi:spore coat protein U-like protein